MASRVGGSAVVQMNPRMPFGISGHVRVGITVDFGTQATVTVVAAAARQVKAESDV